MDARLAGLRLISEPVTDAQEARGLSFGAIKSGGGSSNQSGQNDVFSCSWGPTDDGRRMEGPGPATRLAMLDSVRRGRGGRGVVYVWAAGNGRARRDNCNYDGYANSRLTVTVGAVDSGGGGTTYSEDCAALMVVAPSSGGGRAITTTDLLGNRGTSRNECTTSFGGTSAAAPVVAGIVGLMLGANPELGWRDVMHILVRTAVKTQESDGGWARNGAGLWHSHRYGFGVVNASGAVRAARGWRNVGEMVSSSSGEVVVGRVVSDNKEEGVRSVVIIGADIEVEWVEVVLTVTTPRRGDIDVRLTGPTGMVSQLAEAHDDGGADISGWTFTTCRHWGERSSGVWELHVSDRKSNNVGIFRSCLFHLSPLSIHFLYLYKTNKHSLIHQITFKKGH